MQTRAEYEFTSTDKILHLLWPVTDSKDVDFISNNFKQVDELYIADGHHRCASSARLSDLRGGNENDSHKFFMAYMIPETTIKVQEFNRLVKTLNSLSKNAFLKKLENDFILRWVNAKEFTPASLHEIGSH